MDGKITLERWQRGCLSPMQLVCITVEIPSSQAFQKAILCWRKVSPLLMVSSTYAMLPIGLSSIFILQIMLDVYYYYYYYFGCTVQHVGS